MSASDLSHPEPGTVLAMTLILAICSVGCGLRRAMGSNVWGEHVLLAYKGNNAASKAKATSLNRKASAFEAQPAFW